MTIKDFRGQVKISDIQDAFNEIVDRINTMVDTYNSAGGYSNIDYTKGSAKLGAAGYTLSVGGLKSILDTYNNTLFGCKVYKISDTSVLVSDGIYIKDYNVYRINSRVVSGQSDWDLSELYYDITNDSVMFKNGSSGDIVDVSTSWTQPTINSNTDCGVFTANSNASNAYLATSAGWKATGGNTCELTWNLPKTIDATNITFHIGEVIALNCIIRVYVNDDIVYNETTPSSYTTINKNISVNLDKKVNSIKLYMYLGDGSNSAALSYPKFSNLTVTGSALTIAIDSGGTITPSDDIIKLCNLNWASDDVLLNCIDSLQLEGVDSVSITSQNRAVSKTGIGWESLSTTSSAKFLAYTSAYYNGNASWGGSNSFLGLQLNGGYGDGGGGRNHWTCTALSLIYIPKGFTVVDTHSGQSGRFVFDATLNK